MIRISRLAGLISHRFVSTKSANVNLADVHHHSKLSEIWWDLAGPLKGLHALNKLRVPLVTDGLISTGVVPSSKKNKPDVLEGVKLLDIGCGAGIFTEGLAKLRADITAIDASEQLLETAREHSKESNLQNINYICDLIENHATNNREKYDAVVASEIIEHVVDQKSFLKSCVDTLKPGGSLFITTPNKTQASWLFGIILAENVLKIVPKGTHDWNLFISPEEVERILKDLNCSTVLVNGIKYEFWRNNCEWWSRTDIMYALHSVKDKKVVNSQI